MKSFTKEQLDALKEYEGMFFKAVHQNYYRSMNSKTLDLMKAEYDKVADKPYGANWSCSHCVLAFLQVIGKKYYKDLEAYNKKAAKLVEAIDAVMAEVPTEPEPKVTKNAPAKKSSKKATKK